MPMTAKRVLSFLQKGWTAFVDPDREQRLESGVTAVHKRLAAQRESFDFVAVLKQLEIPLDDRQEIGRRVFLKCLERAWGDDVVTEKEQRSLAWVASKLMISELEVSRIQREKAEGIFERVLADAFADGVLDDAEFAELGRIASSCGSTPADFFRSRFSDQGEGFLRNLFVRVLEDGRLDRDDWAKLVLTMQRLGMSEAAFREAIESPAKQLVEHLLADYKSDESITPDEEACLQWMLTHLICDDSFATYVRMEVIETKLLSAIRLGDLLSDRPPQGVALRAGEIVHFVSECAFTFQRRRGREYVTEAIVGTGVVTDDRFIFISAERSLQAIHSKVLGYKRLARGLVIQCAGPPAGTYEFVQGGRIGTEIWIAAIQKAKQTLVAPRQEANARRIPRDVRQRVWQRYGGRCAECNSTAYLEFDHIIPVARGGGNSDNNIQLLCRGCNSTKSDNI
jgi:hypothetical protein